MSEAYLSRRRVLALTAGLAASGYAGLTAEATGEQSRESRAQASSSSTLMSNSQQRLGDVLAEGTISAGRQVRVYSQADAGRYPSILYTVPSCVGSGDCDDAAAREALDLSEDSDLYVQQFGPHPELTRPEDAKEQDEFVEFVDDTPETTSLIVTAPHGGRIEYRTDDQARLVADALGVPMWACAGYNSGGGAFDRWHVTSTKIDRESFPQLDEMADRQFTHAVSFHGFSEPGIAVGGGASRDMKEQLCAEIEAATDGAYDVYIPSDDSPYAGNSPDNFVNWLTADDQGIQLEQCPDARDDDFEAVAEAVISFYESLGL